MAEGCDDAEFQRARNRRNEIPRLNRPWGAPDLEQPGLRFGVIRVTFLSIFLPTSEF